MVNKSIIFTIVSSKHDTKGKTHRKSYQASCGKQGDILIPCEMSSANIAKKIPSYEAV